MPINFMPLYRMQEKCTGNPSRRLAELNREPRPKDKRARSSDLRGSESLVLWLLRRTKAHLAALWVLQSVSTLPVPGDYYYHLHPDVKPGPGEHFSRMWTCRQGAEDSRVPQTPRHGPQFASTDQTALSLRPGQLPREERFSVRSGRW